MLKVYGFQVFLFQLIMQFIRLVKMLKNYLNLVELYLLSVIHQPSMIPRLDVNISVSTLFTFQLVNGAHRSTKKLLWTHQ